jgi:hypothetical protein
MERISRAKNRMRQSRSSGTVGGEGGNLLAYPANLIKLHKALWLASGADKKIRLTEITVSTANATAKGLKNRIFSPGQGRRGSWKP